MDTIHQEVGTVGHFILQGRVEVILLELDSKMILPGFWSLEEPPLGEVGPYIGFLLIQANFQPLQAVWRDAEVTLVDIGIPTPASVLRAFFRFAR